MSVAFFATKANPKIRKYHSYVHSDDFCQKIFAIGSNISRWR